MAHGGSPSSSFGTDLRSAGYTWRLSCAAWASRRYNARRAPVFQRAARSSTPIFWGGRRSDRANQVWASDLTYLPMAHGFLYLVAILDVVSRKVLSFRVSNTMTPDFCVEA